MCDFSRYGGPSEEWLAVQAGLPTPPKLSLEEKKRTTNEGREKLAAEVMEQLGKKVRIQDYSIPTRDGSSIEARTYRPVSIDEAETLPVYIHFHGGGFFFGTLSSEDAIAARIAINAKVIVLNVNYRHTPEHVYPAPYHDAQDAFDWLHANIATVKGNPEQVVVGGISAGAQLTSSLTLQKALGKACVSAPPIAGQVLMIPCVAHMDCYGPQLAKMKSPDVSSYKENHDAPILSVATCRFFLDLLKCEPLDDADLMLNPGNASPDDVRGLPPTVFGIAGLDPLRDEGLLYAKMLTEAGVATDINLFQGVPHGFRRFGEKLSACERWDEVMENGIRWALNKPQATGEFNVKTE
ncbi:alpha/beta-hydrolase [Thozetella sp. PMI_491]|nr:alpha/beta-hydrolase [Thozetella sp. PMI_491]